MTTKQMEYILELAQTKNFNRAAENLFISQPTMTYQIKAAEEEIGFPIFTRSGRGADLTPAGAQFVSTLRTIHESLSAAIEQGQNFSAKYRESLRIVLPIRSALYFLPDAMRAFSMSRPDTLVVPAFDWYGGREAFLRGEYDILFAMEHEMRQVPDILTHSIFQSRIYLIAQKGDELAQKAIVLPEDLKSRTLMVGGGSPPALRALQARMIREIKVAYFNSHDHATTLTNVKAGRGICLAPGFLNDHNEEFCWIPFETETVIPCALYTHRNDRRKSLQEFIDVLLEMVRAHPDFPV